MMKQPTVALALSVALAACGGTTPPPITNTISGTVYAPTGGDVQNTLVLACFVVSNSCDENKSNAVAINQSGGKATYSIPDLAPGGYAVLALQGQFDAQDNLTALDSIGIYLKGNNTNQQYTLVQTGSSNIDVHLVNPSNPDAGGSTVQPGPGSVLPQELQGEFFVGSPSSLNFYNPSTNTFAPSGGSFQSYTFNPDGTFNLNWLYQTSVYGCDSSLFLSSSGTVQLNGSEMVLNTTDGHVKFTNSCSPSQNYDRSVKPRNSTYGWRVEPDPDSPSITYLYLKEANGNEPRYVKNESSQ